MSEPESSNTDAHSFRIDALPELDLTRGDLLMGDAHKIADLFHNRTTDHTSRKDQVRLLWELTGKAGLKTGKRIRRVVEIGHAALSSSKPHDREFMRKRNPRRERLFGQMIGGLMTGDSKIIGKEHLQEAHAQSAEGNPTVLFANHGLEVDPFLLKILLQRENDADLQAMAESLLVVAGHKAFLDRFRRTAGESMHTLFTIAAKYAKIDSESDQDTVNAYIENVGKVLRELLQTPEYDVLLFPEGGMTKDHQIGFQLDAVQIARNATVIPTMISAPDGFLQLDNGNFLHSEPAQVQIHVGEPISLESGGAGAAFTELIERYRDNLAAVGAPVHNFKFGRMTRDRNGAPGATQFKPLRAA